MSDWLTKSKKFHYYSRVFNYDSCGGVYVMYEKTIDPYLWGSHCLKEVGRIVQGYLLLKDEVYELEYHTLFDVGFCRTSSHHERYNFTRHTDAFFDKWLEKHMKAREEVALKKKLEFLKRMRLEAPCFLYLEHRKEKSYECHLCIDKELNITWKYGSTRKTLPFLQFDKFNSYKMKCFKSQEEIVRYSVLSNDEMTSYELDNLMLS